MVDVSRTASTYNDRGALSLAVLPADPSPGPGAGIHNSLNLLLLYTVPAPGGAPGSGGHTLVVRMFLHNKYGPFL